MARFHGRMRGNPLTPESAQRLVVKKDGGRRQRGQNRAERDVEGTANDLKESDMNTREYMPERLIRAEVS